MRRSGPSHDRYIGNHPFWRRRRQLGQVVKVAAPTLIALPIIASIIYFSGPEWSLLSGAPSTPAGVQPSAPRSTSDTEQPRSTEEVDANEGQNTVPATPERQPTDAESELVDRSGDPPREDATDVDSGSDINGLIQGLRMDDSVSGPLQENPSDTGPARESGSTAGNSEVAVESPRAAGPRQQANSEQQPAETRKPDASTDAFLGQSLLTFPDAPPRRKQETPMEEPNAATPFSLQDRLAMGPAEPRRDVDVSSPLPDAADAEPRDSVAPDAKASSEDQADGSTWTGDALTPPKIVSTADHENGATPKTSAPRLKIKSANDSGSRVACDRAIRSIDRLQATLDRHGDTKMVALVAYRDVSRMGEEDLRDDDAPVASVLRSVSRRDVAAELSSLCKEWIGWQKRQTDGILLIGELTIDGDQRFIRIGGDCRVQLTEDSMGDLSESGRCVAIGRLVTTSPVPRVRLTALRMEPR